MFKLRDVLIFFAGFEFMHTLFHIFLANSDLLPLDFKFIELTPNMNFWAVIVNGAITVLLLLWAWRRS